MSQKPELLEKWQAKHCWAEWDDSLQVVFCKYCKGRNNSKFANGIQLNNESWKARGLTILARHAGVKGDEFWKDAANHVVASRDYKREIAAEDEMLGASPPKKAMKRTTLSWSQANTWRW